MTMIPVDQVFPPHVVSELRAEVQIARAAGVGSDEWLRVFARVLNRHLVPVADGVLRWREAGELDMVEERFDPPAAPGTGPRSDVPPAASSEVPMCTPFGIPVEAT